MEEIDLLLEILDENSLNAYHRLVGIEDETILSLEIWNLEKRLKETIREEQKENSREGLVSFLNLCLYQINCFLTSRRSLAWEENRKQIEESRKMEKQCLNMLKQSLIYSSKELSSQEHHKIVSSIFLYTLVLHQLSIDRNYDRKQQYRKLGFYQKDISVLLPEEYDKDLSSYKKVVEKVKQCTSRLPKSRND